MMEKSQLYRTIFTLLFVAGISLPIDARHYGTDSLSSVPGAMNDPFKGLIFTDPSFTLPKYSSANPVIGGFPARTTGYTINGCPLVFVSESSGPFSFYDYRSWFNGLSDIALRAERSFTPIEYGFFAGPLISIETSGVDTLPSFNVLANNYDGAAGFTVPLGGRASLSGSGRVGYNTAAISDRVRPYYTTGEMDLGAPIYGDYFINGRWHPNEAVSVAFHALGNIATFETEVEALSSASFSSRYYTGNFGGSVNAQIAQNIHFAGFRETRTSQSSPTFTLPSHAQQMPDPLHF